MTLEELFKQFRSDVDDNALPRLWDDSDLETYFNWALEELAKKALYFYDTTTWTAVPVTADDAQVAETADNKLDRILYIRRAKLVTENKRLTVMSMAQSDTQVREDDYGQFLTSEGWETETGTPRVLITDYYEDGSLRLGPIPTVADTISLWAFRLPLRPVSFEQSQKLDLKASLGIREFSHELTLIQGMKAKAYLKEDPETRDNQLAETSQNRFAAELLDIKMELQRRRAPAGTVRYGGI